MRGNCHSPCPFSTEPCWGRGLATQCRWRPGDPGKEGTSDKKIQDQLRAQRGLAEPVSPCFLGTSIKERAGKGGDWGNRGLSQPSERNYYSRKN